MYMCGSSRVEVKVIVHEKSQGKSEWYWSILKTTELTQDETRGSDTGKGCDPCADIFSERLDD